MITEVNALRGAADDRGAAVITPAEIVELFERTRDEPGSAALLIGLWSHWAGPSIAC